MELAMKKWHCSIRFNRDYCCFATDLDHSLIDMESEGEQWRIMLEKALCLRSGYCVGSVCESTWTQDGWWIINRHVLLRKNGNLDVPFLYPEDRDSLNHFGYANLLKSYRSELSSQGGTSWSGCRTPGLNCSFVQGLILMHWLLELLLVQALSDHELYATDSKICRASSAWREAQWPGSYIKSVVPVLH